jgi:fluoroacetyl-CoA thioesterase
MSLKIEAGIKGMSTKTVTVKDTAIAHGSGQVEVFATPAMIALMEQAANDSVQPHLDAGFVTVGTEVNIKHIKATAINRQVRAEAHLTTVEGKKLTFSVEAFDDTGKIGFGTHIRYVVEEKNFRPA